MLQEFKKFIMRGNVIDMAVGIVIGAAFTAIVKSLVSDVIMPPLGMLMAGIDFSELSLELSPAVAADPAAGVAASDAVVIKYGVFINQVINFLIVAFVIFMVVRTINRMKSEPPPADPTTKTCPECMSTIPIKATRCAHCAVEVPAT
ncbi:MAG: large-conductance mechanosensitive channel protein MscL [Planctomycetes bacterium]|nr:large-conductance mechanosensitive channel protein MscL [Planctomycetota bacterium]